MTVTFLVRLAVAAPWLGYGLYAKVLGRVPRHERIVARVLTARHARLLTKLIGLAEIGMAFWVLSAIAPVLCAIAQTLVIITMNVIELTKARDLLLAPKLMLAANALLVGAAWYLALIATP